MHMAAPRTATSTRRSLRLAGGKLVCRNPQSSLTNVQEPKGDAFEDAGIEFYDQQELDPLFAELETELQTPATDAAGGGERDRWRSYVWASVSDEHLARTHCLPDNANRRTEAFEAQERQRRRPGVCPELALVRSLNHQLVSTG